MLHLYTLATVPALGRRPGTPPGPGRLEQLGHRPVPHRHRPPLLANDPHRAGHPSGPPRAAAAMTRSAPAAYGPGFRQTAGATFRLVVGVGAWDNSVR
ncbi:hypothetical protein ACOBQB_14630 [Streptomyces sp. G5(2025)]|uniref:hypothetical protein n=1 Tax=Streptomyces sp. G5(2025) TaxID=3406628 RepID=UPI003C1F17E4